VASNDPAQTLRKFQAAGPPAWGTRGGATGTLPRGFTRGGLCQGVQTPTVNPAFLPRLCSTKLLLGAAGCGMGGRLYSVRPRAMGEALGEQSSSRDAVRGEMGRARGLRVATGAIGFSEV
jgi:hypothetical protein